MSGVLLKENGAVPYIIQMDDHISLDFSVLFIFLHGRGSIQSCQCKSLRLA